MGSLSYVVSEAFRHFSATANIAIVGICQIAAQERQSKTMTAKIVAGTSQLRFMSLYPQCLEQVSSSIAGELFQVTTQSRGALVIRKVSDRRARGNHAETRIEGS